VSNLCNRWTPAIRGQDFAFLLFLVASSPILSLHAQEVRPVSREIAARVSESGLKSVAVVDFTDLEGNVTNLGRFLSDEMSVELVEGPKKFDVIDRAHLKEVLDEHRLAASGLVDPETVHKLGKIIGADALVTGTITPFNDTVRLSIKVLDTETAKVVAASSMDVPKTPTIAGLMAEHTVDPNTKGAVGSSGSRPDLKSSEPSPVVSMKANGFTFAAQECKRLDSLLSCSGFVTNRTENHRLVNINAQTEGISSVVDNSHNQYILQGPSRNRITFGVSGTQQDLEKDIPIKFSISIVDFSTTAKSVNIILACWTNEPYGFFEATLRNVPIATD